MKVQFTRHALLRMEERSIEETEVIKAITKPDILIKDGEKKIAKKIRKNKQLLIIYFTDNMNIIRVITVISTSKLNKYLNNV